MKSIVIIADGTFPTHPHPIEILKKADIIICCDGAILNLPNNISPNYIIGDMDTLSAELQERYHNIIVKSNCQETNDLTKSVSFALGLIPEGTNGKIYILGATGKREDHAIGNISLLGEYYKHINRPLAPFNNIMHKGVTINIITDNGIFYGYNTSCSLDCAIGDSFSIFAFDSSLQITSNGLEYQTSGVTFDYWWRATLNKSTSTKVELMLNHNAPFIIYRPYSL